jgi:hypothetical protein
MSTAIIGNGFCGKRLHAAIPGSAITDLPSLATGRTIPFDYTNPSHWPLLDSFSTIIFTAKIDDLDAAKDLAQKIKNKKVILLSTAKAFANIKPDGTISEKTPLSQSPRNQAEQTFTSFATILHLGLIYGEERSLEKWLHSGKIKNGLKLVNLIEITDLIKIINLIILKEYQSERILISDGIQRPWQSIADNYGISLKEAQTGIESKNFDTSKLKEILPSSFKFQSL